MTSYDDAYLSIDKRHKHHQRLNKTLYRPVKNLFLNCYKSTLECLDKASCIFSFYFKLHSLPYFINYFIKLCVCVSYSFRSLLLQVIDFPRGKVAFTPEMRSTSESPAERAHYYCALNDNGQLIMTGKFKKVLHLYK